MTAPSPNEVIAPIVATLARAGFDATRPFAVDAEICTLFPFERYLRDAAYGLIIANTRSLWTPFLAWVRQRPPCSNPLERYVDETLHQALASVPARVAGTLYLGHHQYPTPSGVSYVPLQRLARQIGLAALAPCHLSATPDLGPWLSLRGVIVLDLDLAPFEGKAAQQEEPCASCVAPCQRVFEQVVKLNPSVRGWQDWLKVRDACPVGRHARFSNDQLRYHYVKDAMQLPFRAKRT